jgi:hypothetical protein
MFKKRMPKLFTKNYSFLSKYILHIFILFCPLILVAQNNATDLFEAPSKNGRLAQVSLNKGEKRVARMRLNSKLSDGIKLNIGKDVNLNLFDNLSIPVKFDAPQKNSYKGLEVYRGRSTDKKFAHLSHYRDVIMISNPVSGNLVLQINNSESFYEIKPLNKEGDYRISEWSNEVAVCNKETYLKNADEAQVSGCEEKDASGKYVIDLFVGYSYQASTIAVDIDAHALSLVEMVNNGLSNSLVNNVYLRLVGTGINQNNPGVVTSVLGNIYTWFADEIAQTSPDYVASIQVPNGATNEAGGWAGVGGYSSVNSIYGSAAVFRHEVGHNMGSSHCTAGIKPYAAGYNNGNSRTHMCGNSVNFYSNPAIVDNLGLPLGDVATADNARLWRERAPEVSARKKHSIKYDENDQGCLINFVNGTYHIQNVNSGKFIGTQGSASSSGTNLVLADSSANTRWNIYHFGDNQFKFEMFQNNSRSIDVPSGSSSPGTKLIVWTFGNTNNQKFSLENVNDTIYKIKPFNSLCLQIENNGTSNGNFVVQNNCQGNISAEWKFIPVYSNKLNVSVSTIDAGCFGQNNGSATVTATGGSGNYTYTWSNGANTRTVNNLLAGTYSVLVSDGSTSISYAVNIKQKDKFAVNITTYISNSTKNGAAKATVTGGIAPYTMEWSNGTNGDSTFNLAPGLYTFSVSDQANCFYEKDIFISCSDLDKSCNDGNLNTIGDTYNAECNCVGVPIVCPAENANIAKGKTASQSSTYGSAVASRAIDGNFDGNYSNGSVAHTNALAPNDWWQVDLGATTKISNAVIYNRSDCCKNRLDSIYVFISSEPFASNNLSTTLNTPGIKKIRLFDKKAGSIVLSPDTLGRYLRIQNARYNAATLNITEVEVFSCGTPIVSRLAANPINANNWELKANIKRQGGTINQIFVEYGQNNFDTIEELDMTGINQKDSSYLFKNIIINAASTYQYRFRVITQEGSFTSISNTFIVSEAYCTPTLGSLIWYKTFNRMRYKNVEHQYSTADYTNLSNITLDSLQMNSTYTMEFRTPDAGWTNLSYKIYIDLNDDKLFTGYNELVGQSIPRGQWTTVSFTIPNTDLKTNIPLRLRLQGYESINSSSCYGEVGRFVDYSVVIKNGACTSGGHITRLYLDSDGDGFGNPLQQIYGNCATNSGYVINNRDFNDNDATIYPNAVDICDNKDNDNDGSTDEDGIPALQSLHLSNQSLQSGTQRVRESITTEQNLNIESDKRVNFYAIKTIELLPGTTISNGAVFKASIQSGCGE